MPAASGAEPAAGAAAAVGARDTRIPVPDAGIKDAALEKAAWARLRWPYGEVLETHRSARLDEPIHAGSIFKLVAARAAIEQGIDVAALRLACPRRVDVRGRRLDCVHADLGRPLTLEDAIAHSCNHYFVRLADRLDRQRLAETFRSLSRTEAPVPRDAPMPLVVLGLDGPRLPMRSWLRVAVAATTDSSEGGHSFEPLRRGAERAATEGSAAALADPTTLTLAKTGTIIAAGGRQEGMVVAWRPEHGDAAVVRVAGGAGRDAAELARALWERAAAAREPHVRVARLRGRPIDAGGTPAIDAVPIETYVAGVVAAEGGSALAAGALQALAILARSYVAAPDGRHARDGYDVCDTTHCQVVGPATSWSLDATRATRGLVLSRGGRVVAVPYSASCSGSLADPAAVWGGVAAVRTTVGPDPGRHEVPGWTSDVTADALLAVLRAAGYRGDVLRDVRVVHRTGTGQPARLALDGLAPADIDATTFRHLVGRGLGWHVLKSHAWELARTSSGYRFTGSGMGHGAGLCVRGASVLAAGGASVERVLATYVPGARVVALQDAVRVHVPASLTAWAPGLREEVRVWLAELRLRLAITAPTSLSVHVHPTREAYQRATGRAWWTSGSTRPDGSARARVDLAPPQGPEGAGRLLATLRHELVHVLTHATLADAPAWAAEGLAVVATGEHRGQSAPGDVAADECPTDAAVTRPGGLHAMREAYVQAAACVARALSHGIGGWRTLRTPPAADASPP